MKRIAFALLALALSGTAAMAEVTCLPLQQVFDTTKAKGFVVVMEMSAQGGAAYQIILDPKTGKWAAIAIPPDLTKACFVAEGDKLKLNGSGI